MALERGGLSEDPGLVVQLVEAALLQHQLRQQQRQPQRVGTKGGPGDGLAAGGRPVSPLEALALEVASDDRLLESLAEDEAGAGAGAGAGMEAEAGLRRRLLMRRVLAAWEHGVSRLLWLGLLSRVAAAYLSQVVRKAIQCLQGRQGRAGRDQK